MLCCFGREGTGSYGVGLARHLRAQGREVIEALRPIRQIRRRAGKSDAVEVDIAVRAVYSGMVLGEPKTADGSVKMTRTLRIARRSAMKAHPQTTKPAPSRAHHRPQKLHDRLRKLCLAHLLVTAARCRPESITSTEAASKLALKSLVTRYQQLASEIDALNKQLPDRTKQAAPDLLTIKGGGTDIAPRCSMLPETIPISCARKPHSHTSAACRRSRPPPAKSTATGSTAAGTETPTGPCPAGEWPPSSDPKTRTYTARRTTEGKSKHEIIRCPKRYLTHEVLKALASYNTALPAPYSPPGPQTA